jgi:hypothetical protein
LSQEVQVPVQQDGQASVSDESSSLEDDESGESGEKDDDEDEDDEDDDEDETQESEVEDDREVSFFVVVVGCRC